MQFGTFLVGSPNDSKHCISSLSWADGSVFYVVLDVLVKFMALRNLVS